MEKTIEIKYQIIATVEGGNFNLNRNKQVDTKLAVAAIRKKLRPALRQYLQGNCEVNFYKLKELNFSTLENKLVGVSAHISNFQSPEVIDLDNGELIEQLGLKKLKVKTSSIALSDGECEIKCLNLCSEETIEKVRSLLDKRVRVVGVPLLIPTEKRKWKMLFLVLDIREQISQLEMLCSTVGERLWAEEWVASKKRMNESLIDLLELKSVKALNIQLKNNLIMKKLIRLAVLMTLSGGRVENIVLSLNLLLIGRSGAGKKIITNVLNFLSPIFKEAQASSVNKVGLLGPTTFKDGKWTHTPGLLPQAHGGCLAIQDAHHIEDMKGIAGIISMTTEDGILRRSNAAMSQMEAIVSLLLDMNRKGQITGKKSENEVDDLWGIPIHVLTRFDCIVDLPADIDRQLTVAVEMLKNFKNGEKDQFKTDQRKVQLIVAYVKDSLPSIDITEEVKTYAVEKWGGYFDENRAVFNEFPNLGDFQLRMTNSLIKLIIAIARAHFRNTATIADVDEATNYLKFKIDYLVKVAPDLTSKSLTKNIKDKPSLRRKSLKSKFTGKAVTFTKLKKFYREEFGFSEDGLVRKIYRDLDGVAVKGGKGLWKFN